MEGEVAIADTTAPVDSGEASSVDAAPVADPVDDTGSTVESAQEASPPPAVEAAPEAPALPDPTAFNWDEWDGESYDVFDEPVRPWVERISQFHQSKMDTHLERERQELQEIRSIYEELMSGHEDPRLKATMEELEQLRSTLQEQQTKYTELETQHAEYQAAIDAMAEQEAKAMADRFREENPDIFEDREKAKLLGELLDEDWDLTSIPRVINLSPEAQKTVRQAKRDGVPEKYALKLAEAQKPRAPKPRPASDLVSGATGATPTPRGASTGMGDAKSFDDVRSLAVKRAMKHSGRR